MITSFATLASMKFRSLCALALLALVLTGCRTTVTNLTPRQLPGNDKGLYPVEVALDTTQRTVVDDTVKAYVIVGLDSYPMQKTPLLKNRWETLIPVGRGTNFLHYKYKFDYETLAVPQRRPGSLLSPTYMLEIIGQ